MDCDRGTISRIESGRAGCKLENALKIAQVCGVPFTELFGEFDSLTPTQERK
jgi:DNA-binding XRE family transcriptional regulator